MGAEQFQIYMFHFRCPLCAASPKRILLREYLQKWSSTSPERLRLLLCAFSGALNEVRTGNARWLTKKFGKAAARLQNTLTELNFDPALNSCSHLRPSGKFNLLFDTECPVCLLEMANERSTIILRIGYTPAKFRPATCFMKLD